LRKIVVARANATGVARDRVSFPLYDGHGNTIATLARNGTGYSIANVKRYDVWGKVRSDSSVGSSEQILNPTQKYCGNLGHKYDATSGLTYMRARYYEAETGRFISQDPARKGANWYVYCSNMPTINVDPTGKDLSNAYFWFGLGIVLWITSVVLTMGDVKQESLIASITVSSLAAGAFANAFSACDQVTSHYLGGGGTASFIATMYGAAIAAECMLIKASMSTIASVAIIANYGYLLCLMGALAVEEISGVPQSG